jgi:hypothetical protein
VKPFHKYRLHLDVFILYDYHHTRGIDVRQYPIMKGIVYIDDRMTWDTFSQSIGRMRNIKYDDSGNPDGSGHTIYILSESYADKEELIERIERNNDNAMEMSRKLGIIQNISLIKKMSGIGHPYDRKYVTGFNAVEQMVIQIDADNLMNVVGLRKMHSVLKRMTCPNKLGDLCMSEKNDPIDNELPDFLPSNQLPLIPVVPSHTQSHIHPSKSLPHYLLCQLCEQYGRQKGSCVGISVNVDMSGENSNETDMVDTTSIQRIHNTCVQSSVLLSKYNPSHFFDTDIRFFDIMHSVGVHYDIDNLSDEEKDDRLHILTILAKCKGPEFICVCDMDTAPKSVNPIAKSTIHRNIRFFALNHNTNNIYDPYGKRMTFDVNKQIKIELNPFAAFGMMIPLDVSLLLRMMHRKRILKDYWDILLHVYSKIKRFDVTNFLKLVSSIYIAGVDVINFLIICKEQIRTKLETQIGDWTCAKILMETHYVCELTEPHADMIGDIDEIIKRLN